MSYPIDDRTTSDDATRLPTTRARFLIPKIIFTPIPPPSSLLSPSTLPFTRLSNPAPPLEEESPETSLPPRDAHFPISNSFPLDLLSSPSTSLRPVDVSRNSNHPVPHPLLSSVENPTTILSISIIPPRSSKRSFPTPTDPSTTALPPTHRVSLLKRSQRTTLRPKPTSPLRSTKVSSPPPSSPPLDPSITTRQTRSTSTRRIAMGTTRIRQFALLAERFLFDPSSLSSPAIISSAIPVSTRSSTPPLTNLLDPSTVSSAERE